MQKIITYHHKKTAAACVILFLAAAWAAGQNGSVELPSVTTNIAGSAVDIPAAVIPDFSTILPKGTASMPVLPQEKNIPAGAESSAPVPAAAFGKSGMFVDGVIGSGFPGSFIGLFSITQPAGDEPFAIQFNHNEKSGYGEQTAAHGFSSTSTYISGKKRTSLVPSMTIDTAVSYNSSSAGMQHISPVFFNMMHQQFRADVSWRYTPAKDWLLTASMKGSFSVQSPGTADDAAADTRDESVMYSRFSFSPEFAASYASGRIQASAAAGYKLDTRKNPLTDVSVVNRGSAVLSGTYTYDFFDISADAGVVAASEGVIVPFSLSGSVKLISPLSSTPLEASAGGGLRSVSPDISLLEQEYIYCNTDSDALEQSDWFATISLDLPVHISLGHDITASLLCDFASTAFGAGSIVPDYDTFDSTTGLFAVKRVSSTSLDSLLSVSYAAGMFKLTAGWNARWLDRSYGEEIHALAGEASYAAAKNKWGAAARADWEIGSAGYPEVSVNGHFSVSSSLSFYAEAEDIVCFVTGTSRQYAGSYTTYGGALTVSARFKF